jgi:hypothetical protein
MRDELFDRSYAAGRDQLNDGIDRLLHSMSQGLGASLKALHRIEWSAPWHRQGTRA